ncbi:MAG: PAS domain-containing protein [Bauldia sp.]
MKHFASRDLLAHWDRMRAGGVAAHRRDIDPGAIPRTLGDVFILGDDRRGTHRFRLAGTRLCAAFGRELRDTGFLDLWAGNRPEIAAMLAAVRSGGRLAVAEVTATASGAKPATFELLLLPLIQDGPGCDRILGLLAPLTYPAWLGQDPIADLRPTRASLIWAESQARVEVRLTPRSGPEASPQPQAGWGRDRFVVFAGGKAR